MAANVNTQTYIHTHNFRKCSHASVGLAQARPSPQSLKLSESETQLTPTAKASTEAGSLLDNGRGVDRSISCSYLRFSYK